MKLKEKNFILKKDYIKGLQLPLWNLIYLLFSQSIPISKIKQIDNKFYLICYKINLICKEFIYIYFEFNQI